MVEEYLLTCHRSNILEIATDPDIKKHYSVNISFVELFENDTNLGNNILKKSEETLEKLDRWIMYVQENLIQENKGDEAMVLKPKVHARVYGLPVCPELHRTIFPKNEDLNLFLQVTGTVVRVTSSKMLEFQRPYMCTKCKHTNIVEAVYDQKYTIAPPKKCSNPDGCSGTNLISLGDLDVENCKDYQEIKIQEQPSKLGVGTMPGSMWVTLEDDLVDACKPGDDITVCGTVKRRWGCLVLGKRVEVELVLKASHIQINNDQASSTLITPEVHEYFATFWEEHKHQPLLGRDLILKSFCPKLYGMYMVKLAIAIILAGGSRCKEGNDIGIQIRSEPHILLVGDPGTGKSQLLRYAAKIIPRSVLTTGVGTTSAGLTCAAIMEDGQWQLEGGALVLADGGICCIDEFNSMKSHDRTSIHEAMEQQTISVAKASMVCKLRTRCSILAATNPKGGYLDPSQPLSLNLTLPSPLLSRFDIVLMLKDNYDKDWDNLVADYILSGKGDNAVKVDASLWNFETLQKYFTIIRNFNPILTSQANKILSNYYQVQRRVSRNKARTTVRLLDSLVRLSQAHARLMFHTEVRIMDALFAVILIESSMYGECSVVLSESINIQAPFSDSPMKSYEGLLKTILSKLGLLEILKDEIFYLQNGCKYNLESAFDNDKSVVNENSLAGCSFILQKDEETNVEERDNNQSSANLADYSQTILESSVQCNSINNREMPNSSKYSNFNEPEEKTSKENIKQDEHNIGYEEKLETLTKIDDVSHNEVKKRKNRKSHEDSKKSKASKLNDFQMLNLIRSVNDEFDPNILNFENPDSEISYDDKNENIQTTIDETNSLNSEGYLTKELSQNTKLKQFREKFSFKRKSVISNLFKSTENEGNLKNDTVFNSESNIELNKNSQGMFKSEDDNYECFDFIQDSSKANIKNNNSDVFANTLIKCERNEFKSDEGSVIPSNQTETKISFQSDERFLNSEKSSVTRLSQNTKLKQFKEKFRFKPRNIPDLIVPAANAGRENAEPSKTIPEDTENVADSRQNSQTLFISKDEDYESLNFDF